MSTRTAKIDIEIAFLQAQIRRAFAMDDFGTTGKLRREMKLRVAERERLLLPRETAQSMVLAAATARGEGGSGSCGRPRHALPVAWQRKDDAAAASSSGAAVAAEASRCILK
jgi:hypothetical protein